MRTLVKLFILTFVLVNLANAQVILPMGLGQKNSLNVTCSNDNNVWVVNNENGNFVINKWDGNFWIKYSDIPLTFLNSISTLPQSIEAKAIYYYDKTIYLALSNKFNEKLLLIKNSGKKWEAVNTDNIKVANNLCFLNTSDGLLLCGKITVGSQLITILNIGQTKCSIYAGISANHGASDYYTDFETINNTIWAFGFFTDNTESRYFAKLDKNKNWNLIPSSQAPFANGNIAISKYNKKLVIAGVDFDFQNSFGIQKTDTTWEEISNGLNNWKINSISDMRQIDKNFWVAGQFTNTITKNSASLAYWNGNTWTIPNFDFNYLGNDLKLNGNTVAIISGSFNNYQGLILNHTGILDFGSAIVAGKVFYDINQNCTQEYGENSLSGIIVKLNPENLYTITYYNGHYYFPIDSSSKSQFLIELQTPKYQTATCGSIKPAIITSQLTIAGIDFGLKINGTHTDAAVNLYDYTGWRARQGFTETYKLCVENKGTQKIESGKLTFKPDAKLTNWTFSEKPFTWQNNIAEWNINTLLVGAKYCINAILIVPVDIALGSEVLFEARLAIGDLEDEDIANNLCILKQKIVAAIDPNDKHTQQNYYIDPSQKVIDYNIRFQNTGSDTAYNILITDTIDPNLSISYLGIQEEVSHYKNLQSAITYWKQPNGKYQYKIAWRFNNILLADDKTNEEKSHGFINYRLNLANSLALGTTLNNRAFIYFDYQEPILTNVAKNIISKENLISNLIVQNQLKIYPNPANESITISNTYRNPIPVKIINSLGQTVYSKIINAESNLSINTAEMAKGIYIINAEGYAPSKLVIN